MTEKLTLKKKSAKDILTRKPKKKSDTFVAFIPKDGELKVQFLTHPFEWLPYYEIFSDDGYHLFEHDEDAYEDIQEEYGKTNNKTGKKSGPATRFMAPALDVAESRVIVVKMPQTLVKSLMEYADRKDAEVTEYTFELYKTGERMETKYLFDADKSHVDIERFADKVPDLEKVLDELINPPSDDDLADDAIADDSDEAPAKPKLRLKK